jgi:hypothetical protein
MSVDFQLPREGQDDEGESVFGVEDLQAYLDPVLVPVATLEKKKLTHFNFWDESGRALPHLTTAENGHLAGIALGALAKGIGGSYGWTTLEPEVDRALQGVARLRPDLAQSLVRCLTGWPTREAHTFAAFAPPEGIDTRTSDEIAFFRLARGLMRVERTQRSHRHRTILANPVLEALCWKLANDFVVFAPVPEPIYERRIVKFSYEKQIALEGKESRLGGAWRGVAERCAWTPLALSLDRIDVGDAESHHLEIVAPEGTRILDGIFLATAPRDGASALGYTEEDDEYWDTWEDLHDARNDSRAHLYLRELPSQAEATALLRIQAGAAGTPTASMLVAALIAALFFAGRSHADDVQAADAAAFLMLAVPSVFAFYITRLDEHDMVKYLLTGVRGFVYLSGALAFLAAGAFAFGYHDDAVLALWKWLRWAALVPFAALFVAWMQLLLRKPIAEEGQDL